jgi:hypothetical protein
MAWHRPLGLSHTKLSSVRPLNLVYAVALREMNQNRAWSPGPPHAAIVMNCDCNFHELRLIQHDMPQFMTCRLSWRRRAQAEPARLPYAAPARSDEGLPSYSFPPFSFIRRIPIGAKGQ